MHVFRMWRVLCVLGFVMSSCAKEAEYGEDYDNKGSENKQQGDTPTAACPSGDVSRWDNLFSTLENSEMRQNMVLESLNQCCTGAGGTPFVRMQQGLLNLREEEAAREKRSNATLQQLLRDKAGGLTRPNLGTKPFAPDEEVDFAAVGKALAVIATDLQQIHLQLSRVMEIAQEDETEETPTDKTSTSQA